MTEIESLKFDESSLEFSSCGDKCDPKSYFRSLINTNKNLSCAKNKSEVAFCYDRRSRVYFAMGQYRKCWRNIEQARDCGVDLSPDVDDIEAKCHELMLKEDSSQSSFFNLSYPANDKNPSLVDCIKLCVSKQFGRHLVTTQKLKAGDVIAIEKPFYKSLDKNAAHGRCANCFKSNLLDLIPCRLCTSMMFCSKDCEESSWKGFHKYECSTIDDMTQDDGFLMMIQRSLFHALNVCGGLENLQRLVSADKLPTTVFDLDLNVENENLQKELLIVCQSLEASPITKFDRMFAHSFVTNHEHVKRLWTTERQRDFLVTFLVKLIGVMNRNGFTMHWTSPEESGCAIFPSLSLVNHSCAPNLFRILVDGSLVFVVRRPIAVGEQLFICYQWVELF